MHLKAYVHAAPAGRLRLWVGVFGAGTPPALTFRLDGAPVQPANVPPGQSGLHPIRDRQGRNHQGMFEFTVAAHQRHHRVEVSGGGAVQSLTAQTLPPELPQTLDDEFHLLLTSCYFQPNDAGGLLGTTVRQLRRQPDMVLLAGDQVYLDLPLFEDLPEGDAEMARAIGEKYRKNWTSDALGIPGLEPVLSRAPVVCLPDDHEFWNNYPFKQKQLPNTWREAVRERWHRHAQALYHDYQVGGAPTAVPRGAVRIDVKPLRMLFIDMRCARDQQFQALMSADARQALQQWANDLLTAHQQGQPAVGLIASGQALFIEPPREESKQRNVDAEMGNYAEFGFVLQQIGRLTEAGIPVVYVTGDVHWSRVARAADALNNRALLYEVICSPSRLIDTPLQDTYKQAKSFLRGIFGPRDPWPRHPDVDAPPPHVGPNRRYQPEQIKGLRGDQVAVLSFSGGSSVRMKVTYYAVHDNKDLARSVTVGPYTLNNM